MIKKHNLLPGLTLITIAIVMMGSAMGIIPDIPWFRLMCAIVLGSWTIRALTSRDFFGMLFSASLIAWLFEEEFMIDDLAPFPLVVAAAFLGIGLNMLIGKRKRIVSFEYSDGNGHWREGGIEEARKEEWQDGRTVVLSNVFNSTSKYVNATSFSSANLENTFGSANVYNCEGTIELENNFGRMNIYLPGKWRATISQESAFGHVSIHGEPNRDMDAPHVIIKAESNFGHLNIFFE